MRVVMVPAVVFWLGGLGFAAIGCANDPVYIPGPMAMEGGIPDMDGVPSEAKVSLQLPIKLETASDMAKRAELAATLAPVLVPYVKVGDLEVEVEWTIKNLDTGTMDGHAKVQLNGANEFFAYDPSLIVLDPEDEELKAPGLSGDVPITIPPGGQVSGLFTEDDLREASIDLDQITRGNVNPFRATLTVSKNAQAFQPMTLPDAEGEQMAEGPAVPRAAFAEITRIDLVFKPDRRMVLEYNVRVRDLRGIMHDLLLTAVTEKPGELQTFDPQTYELTAAP